MEDSRMRRVIKKGSGKEGKEGRRMLGGGGGVGLGKDGNGLAVGLEIEIRTATSDETNEEGSVLKFEFGEDGNAASVVGHPELEPALVTGGRAERLAEDFDETAWGIVFELEGSDLLAGHFCEEGFLVFEDIPGDGFSYFPWVGADMIEHGAEVFGGTVGQIKVFFGFPWGWEEATEFNGVVGQGSAIADVTAFATVLNIFHGTPRLKLREGGEATTDRIKGLDGTAGAESKFKSLYSFALGFFFCGEDGFGCIEGTVLDEVGEFLSLMPWERGQRLRLAVGEN